MRNFTIIAGMNLLGGIGYKGSIPWNEPVDMKFFKYITLHNDDKNKESKNVVIMGRKTFESLKCKPLKDRINYVVTSKEFDNVICKKSLDECLNDLNETIVEGIKMVPIPVMDDEMDIPDMAPAMTIPDMD